MWNIHHVGTNIQDKRMRQLTMRPKFAKLYLQSRGCRSFVVGLLRRGPMPMLTLLVTVLVELEGGTVVSISFGKVSVGETW